MRLLILFFTVFLAFPAYAGRCLNCDSTIQTLDFSVSSAGAVSGQCMTTLYAAGTSGCASATVKSRATTPTRYDLAVLAVSAHAVENLGITEQCYVTLAYGSPTGASISTNLVAASDITFGAASGIGAGDVVSAGDMKTVTLSGVTIPGGSAVSGMISTRASGTCSLLQSIHYTIYYRRIPNGN